VAVACQGGGSHTAFTAGVLSHVFSPEVLEDFDIVGLSGTSGGAICALVAWSALLQGRPEEAGDRLRRFWSANSTSMPVERLANSMMLWGSRMTGSFTTPNFSPYDSFLSAWNKEHLRTLVRSVIDFDELEELATDAAAPMLLLGAMEVLTGELKTFSSRRGEITADSVLASAAIATMFRSISVHGGAYWDGFMSQNPPVRDLMGSSPDEIWVVQVNPTSIDYEPTTVAEIANRRNELTGNLALLQELNAMEVFDDLIDRGELKSDRVRPVTIRLLEMRQPRISGRWGATSKLNRDPTFIRELIALGKDQAADFIASIEFENLWRTRDVNGMLHRFADDATISADVPGCRVERTSRTVDVHRFVTEQLLDAARIDLTRKRVVRDSVSWEVRFPGGLAHHRGLARVTFRDGLVTDFALTTTVL
jgi:NTE family protein